MWEIYTNRGVEAQFLEQTQNYCIHTYPTYFLKAINAVAVFRNFNLVYKQRCSACV